MDSPNLLRPICLVMAGATFVAGGLGMGAGFLFLAFTGGREMLAGAAGFVAGAILVAAGLLSMTYLAANPARSDAKGPSHSLFN